MLDRRGFLFAGSAAAFTAAVGECTAMAQQDANPKQPARVSIQPLMTDRLDADQLPAELVKDERGFLKRGIDLPVVLLRSTDYPGAVWTLRLPEMGFLGHEGRTGYQVKYRWKQTGANAYAYDWHPITGDRLDRGPLPGKIRCHVAVKGATRVEFQVQYKNESQQPWQLPMVWICLIHKYAGPGRSYYWSGKDLAPTADIPDPKDIWLKLFSVKGHEAFAAAHRKWDD